MLLRQTTTESPFGSVYNLSVSVSVSVSFKITKFGRSSTYQRGLANPRRRHTINWQKFCRNLHENERNWASLVPPLDPPLIPGIQNFLIQTFPLHFYRTRVTTWTSWWSRYCRVSSTRTAESGTTAVNLCTTSSRSPAPPSCRSSTTYSMVSVRLV